MLERKHSALDLIKIKIQNKKEAIMPKQIIVKSNSRAQQIKVNFR